MHASSSNSSGMFAAAETFAFPAAADVIPGVASLDSHAAQQTKSEIRSLAEELAQLAHAGLEPADFYDGFLPRLCAAMGAKGAAVWRLDPAKPPLLVAEHALPAALLVGRDPLIAPPDSNPPPADQADQPIDSRDAAHRSAKEAHQRILLCVAAEGQPILVPPGSVKLHTERPTNPFSDALIVIPLRPEENIQFLLEVIQRPTGGPAAQRGYLRFVAQMGDLMTDYLRREQLRRYAAEHARLERIEDWLTSIAQVPTERQRCQLVADAIVDLFQAERALILVPDLRNCVIAINGTRNFDARSEAVLAAQALYRQYRQHLDGEDTSAESAAPRPLRFEATDRRTAASAQPIPPASASSWQASVDRFCETLACRHGLVVTLDESTGWTVVVAFASEGCAPLLAGEAESPKHWRVLRALVGLLHGSRWSTPWLKAIALPAILWSGGPKRLPGLRQPSLWSLAQRWLLRAALLGLIAAVACFPVSQQIAATAILQPLSKQMYYAPAAGIVTNVLVEEGEGIASGAPLLHLTSHELETQAENLQIELKKTRGQIAEKTSRLNRGEALSSMEKDQLEFDLQELDTVVQSLELQRNQNAQRLKELIIVARQSGTVSTWDLRNRLLHHPVQAGQLLVSTFDPQDQWRLQLSVPDYRAGLIANALQRATNGAVTVNFSLVSHPDIVLQAYAVDMAPQVTLLNDGGASTAHVVKAAALIKDPGNLPLKKDGAIARASVDCGRVPLCWLIIRDAYWALSSRLRMLW